MKYGIIDNHHYLVNEALQVGVFYHVAGKNDGIVMRLCRAGKVGKKPKIRK